MKTILICLLTLYLASCSIAKSAIKSGEWHVKHKQLMFVIPTAEEEKQEHIRITTCTYKQMEWEYRYQRRACVEYSDKNGDEWLLIFSRDHKYVVFLSKNGDIIYLLREPYVIDV